MRLLANRGQLQVQALPREHAALRSRLIQVDARMATKDFTFLAQPVVPIARDQQALVDHRTGNPAPQDRLASAKPDKKDCPLWCTVDGNWTESVFDRRNLRWPLEVVVRPAADTEPAALDQAIADLSGEHPRFTAIRDLESLSILVGACDERQMEESLKLLGGEIPGGFDVGALEVGFRETIGRAAVAYHTHRTGDGDRFARVKLAVEPLGARLDFRFEDKAAGNAVPQDVVPGIERGIQSLLNRGPWSEFPLIGVKASLLDGACDDGEPSAMSFEIASRAAFREAVLNADPLLLEPVSKVVLVTPDGTVGVLTDDLESWRGRITGKESRNGSMTLEALVPVTNLGGYVNSLAHMTQGRASCSVEFNHYEKAPVMKGDGPPSPESASAALRASRS